MKLNFFMFKAINDFPATDQTLFYFLKFKLEKKSKVW